MDLTWTLELL